MGITARDLLHDAGLFHRAYPDWPLGGPAPEFVSPAPAAGPEPAETTIGWGDDTTCERCLEPLPAGATAVRLAAGLLCVLCAAGELGASQ